MELFFYGHDYKYAAEQILLMLFPEERPVYPEKPSGASCARITVSEGARFLTAATRLTVNGVNYFGRAAMKTPPANTDPDLRGRLERRLLRQSFYRAGVRCLGRKPVWGALSGVRPGKLMRTVLKETPDRDRAAARFSAMYDVDPDRARLTLSAAEAAMAAEQRLSPRDVCLYVGIPFCPTRCAYCSFVSQSVEKSMHLIPPFTEALLRDIRATGAAVTEAGLRPVAVYFGGGTPTTLPADLSARVLQTLHDSFDLSACTEFTVEAGRPDTVTEEKLRVLRDYGVTRVSVNPQTMSDRVLAAIGRKHTAADVLQALETVRAVGGFQVNMDLIAGLPEDTADSFRTTVNTVLSLGAENITVHTLALKKGSRILLDGTNLPLPEEVGEMLSFANETLSGRGYAPYYLYRQKFMSGGFENVGWCLPGTENLYNICIMEELCGVIAMGAGASTKLVGRGGSLQRICAPKYPQEYIAGIDAICAGRDRIKEFYHELFTHGDQF